MILLIDNYDSFSYNLYQMIGAMCGAIQVIRNDAMSPDAITALHPAAIILSPGPGKPRDAGVCMDVVKQLGTQVPILGVCLGHQAICEAYGATVSYAKHLMHGKQSTVTLQGDSPLFRGLPEQIPVARYHSLAAQAETIPADLLVTAVADDGEIMAVQHRTNPVYGIQFHPESILTPDGNTILQHFLEVCNHD